MFANCQSISNVNRGDHIDKICQQSIETAPQEFRHGIVVYVVVHLAFRTGVRLGSKNLLAWSEAEDMWPHRSPPGKTVNVSPSRSSVVSFLGTRLAGVRTATGSGLAKKVRCSRLASCPILDRSSRS
jgi:hypothetical protein